MRRSWNNRPTGKVGVHTDGIGKRLVLLLNAAMEAHSWREYGSKGVKDPFWWSGITLNLGGIAGVHCDSGNLGKGGGGRRRREFHRLIILTSRSLFSRRSFLLNCCSRTLHMLMQSDV